MSNFMRDSGHQWMHDCDECGGLHHCAPPEDDEAEEAWTCEACEAHNAALAKAEQERQAWQAATECETPAEAEAQNAQTREALADVIGRLVSACVWCGEETPTGLTAPEVVQRVRAHVATCPAHPMRAIEQERDDLQASHDVLERQRNEAQAELAAAVQRLDEVAEKEATAHKVWKEAVADNAALVEALGDVACRSMDTSGGADAHDRAVKLHAQPHPGTALLEQHRKELEAARYADDNVKAFTDAICSTIEHAELLANTPKGGQSVPNHNDFAHVQPSTRGHLRWWARCGRAALKGERSALLVRARNEGLEMAAGVADACVRERSSLMDGLRSDPSATERLVWLDCKRSEAARIAEAVRRMKEPEE